MERRGCTAFLVVCIASLLRDNDVHAHYDDHYDHDNMEDHDYQYNHWRTEPPSNIEDLSFGYPFESHFAYNGDRNIKNWDLGGTARVHKHFLRLTGESQSTEGWLHAELPCGKEHWNVDLKMRISGSGEMFFGDGLAFWYVDRSFHIGGGVMGSEDQWNGLAIFFDTFQNSDMGHDKPHPYIYALLNDGNKTYKHSEENHKYEHEDKLVPGQHGGSGCTFNVRYYEHRDDFGVTSNFTVARIAYDGELKTLTLKLRNGGEHAWTDCISLVDVELPATNYFALTAQTGDLVDNHDILSLHVTETSPTDDFADALPPIVAPSVTSANYVGMIQNVYKENEELKRTVSEMQHFIEYHLTDVRAGVKKNEKDLSGDNLKKVVDSQTEEIKERVTNDLQTVLSTVESIEASVGESQKELTKQGSSWTFPFLIIFLLVAGLGYKHYQLTNQVNKYHLP